MECPICWESLVSTSLPVVSIPCGHLFHEGCLAPVTRRRLSSATAADPDCPTCRTPIKLITGHDLNCIPASLRDSCHAAVRRVYLTPPDAAGNDTQRETDYLYTRLAQTQESLQKSKQKEKSAEQRLKAIMDLWKKEQAKNAELLRTMRAFTAEESQRTAKVIAPPPALPVAPPHVPLPPPAAPPILTADPWILLEHDIVTNAARYDNVWRTPGPAPPQLGSPLPLQYLDFQFFPVGPAYQQPMPAPPMPQQPTGLPPVHTGVPMPSLGVAVQTGPATGSTLPWFANQPQLPIPPSPAHHAAQPPVPVPLPARMQTPVLQPFNAMPPRPAPPADPRPRHLSGPARERELARIRLLQDRARIQALVHHAPYAVDRQPSQQQGVAGAGQRWEGAA